MLTDRQICVIASDNDNPTDELVELTRLITCFTAEGFCLNQIVEYTKADRHFATAVSAIWMHMYFEDTAE